MKPYTFVLVPVYRTLFSFLSHRRYTQDKIIFTLPKSTYCIRPSSIAIKSAKGLWIPKLSILYHVSSIVCLPKIIFNICSALNDNNFFVCVFLLLVMYFTILINSSTMFVNYINNKYKKHMAFPVYTNSKSYISNVLYKLNNHEPASYCQALFPVA